MFSVLVMLEGSENVWSDHLRQKMANPATKNRFFHFRHAVSTFALAADYKQLECSAHIALQSNHLINKTIL